MDKIIWVKDVSICIGGIEKNWNITIGQNFSEEDKYYCVIDSKGLGEDTFVGASSKIRLIQRICHHIDYHYSFNNKLSFIRDFFLHHIQPLVIDSSQSVEFINEFDVDKEYIYITDKITDYIIFYVLYFICGFDEIVLNQYGSDDFVNIRRMQKKYEQIRLFLKEKKIVA